MSGLLAHPVGRFRLISGIEGLSYILLLFVAMPLKYVAGEPLAVRIVGMAHGWLFIGFVLALLAARRPAGWTWTRTVLLFALSLVPFGALAIERFVRAEGPPGR